MGALPSGRLFFGGIFLRDGKEVVFSDGRLFNTLDIEKTHKQTSFTAHFADGQNMRGRRPVKSFKKSKDYPTNSATSFPLGKLGQPAKSVLSVMSSKHRGQEK